MIRITALIDLIRPGLRVDSAGSVLKRLALVSIVLLYGCVGQPFRTSGEGAVETASEAAGEEEVFASFEPDTLYDLLVAEIGGQRQRYDLALGNYLKQAHKTRDAGVAQRAYQIGMFVGARQAALDAALLWVELEPENVFALQASALELVYSGQLTRAAAQMRRQLELGGEASFDLLASGASEIEDGARRELIGVFDEILKDYPDNRELLLGRAILYRLSGDDQRALDITNRLLRKDRDDVKAMIVKGRVLKKLGRSEEAEKMLSDAVARHPERGRLRLLYARVLVHANKLDEARKQFEVLLEQSPHDSEIVLSLALITMENEMEPEAEQYFRQLLALGQRKNTANYYLGRLKEKQRQYGAARDYYQAVGQGKEFMAAQVALAQMLVRQGKLSEALVLIDEARTRNPARVESLYLLEGELLVNDGQLKKALELFDKAIKSSPKSVNLLYSRAMLQEKLDNLLALEKDLRKLLEIDPENPAALNALGYTLADRTDRYREAEKLILKAYSLNQEDPAILDSMGWVQYRLGNYESAVKYLRLAYDKFPDAEIAAHLGEVIWVMGNREEAMSLWGQALKKSPDSRILKDTMDRLEKQGLKPVSPTSGVPLEAVSQVK